MQRELRIGQQIGFGNPYRTGTVETPRAEGQNVGLLFAREELPAERPSRADDAVHDHAAFACAPNGRLQHPDPRLAQPFDLRNSQRIVGIREADGIDFDAADAGGVEKAQFAKDFLFRQFVAVPPPADERPRGGGRLLKRAKQLVILRGADDLPGRRGHDGTLHQRAPGQSLVLVLHMSRAGPASQLAARKLDCCCPRDGREGLATRDLVPPYCS
jgi:hypothetical protein